MIFSTMTFTFVFLPIVLLLHFIVKKEARNVLLLLASLVFYAWAGQDYFKIIILTILINYFGAILINNYSKYKKIFLFLTVSSNLAFLFYYKYFNFVVNITNNFFNSNFSIIDIVLPIGISFYIFQAISYVTDVYRGQCNVQKNLLKLALYISFFPQLVSGPIVKYHDIENQIDNRDVNIQKFSQGVKRFIIGLAKKLLIADTMGCIADKIFIQDPTYFSHGIAWLGSIAYTFQIYFDFSGYSDMAIGLGLMFGFKFLENFNYPYISKSMTEYWRRWHISLSTWFKEYVYIPLGGNRQGKFRQIRNLGIVFLLTGIWHGASFNFVIWGLWNGFFIILEKCLNINNESTNKCVNFFKHIYLILVVVLGFVIFRAGDIVYATDYLMNMFGLLKTDSSNFIYALPYYVDTVEVITFVSAILCAVPIFKDIINSENIRTKILVNIWLILIFFLSTAKMASETYNPFIYFQF